MRCSQKNIRNSYNYCLRCGYSVYDLGSKAEDEERKLYGDDYYLPEMEELPSTAETVIFTLMLAVGCGIAWIVIPLLIIGVMLQEKISKNFPELMGKIFEETEEENK